MKKSMLMLALIPVLGLTACGGSDSSDSVDSTVPVEVINEIPVVDAGAEQTVVSAQEVTITASISDDDEVVTTWSQTSGTTVTINQVDSTTITFTAPELENQEVLTFELTVDDGTNAVVSDSVDIIVTPQTTTTVSSLSSWIINNETSSEKIASTSGSVLVNVQVAEMVTVVEDSLDVEYAYVETTGIPKYDVTITESIVEQLNQRPKAATDFSSGSTSAVAGQVVTFGEDIGYNSSTENCLDTGGDGYWPPGPGCPTEQTTQAYFPAEPTVIDETEEACETGLGKIGLMVNGTSIYNWGDGMSEGNNVWYSLAPVAEQYDVDICGGHAAQGDYHHHFYTSCLATLVGDSSDAHSPIYGFAADGYPLYGPYESENTLAISGWKIRDYGLDASEGGCSTEGERSCILVDPADISQGVETVANGPAIGEDVNTLSGNVLAADDGYFYEDYYFANETVTGAQLDKHNGHDTNDGKGYHYHITLTQDADGTLMPAYPYTIGPDFKGELATNSISQCGTSAAGGGPPGGGPPNG
jgi:hypothetical protein